MRGVTFNILATFVLQTCAKEMKSSSTSNAKHTVAKQADELLDVLVDKLFDRKLSATPGESLDNAVLGKPGRIANLQAGRNVLQARPVMGMIPLKQHQYNPASQVLSHTRPAIPSMNAIFQSPLISRNPLLLKPGLVQAEGDEAPESSESSEEKKDVGPRGYTSSLWNVKRKKYVEELRAMDADSLVKELTALKNKSLDLRIAQAIRREDFKSHTMRETRHNIARVLTIYTEKQNKDGMEKFPRIKPLYFQGYTKRQRRVYSATQGWRKYDADGNPIPGDKAAWRARNKAKLVKPKGYKPWNKKFKLGRKPMLIEGGVPMLEHKKPRLAGSSGFWEPGKK